MIVSALIFGFGASDLVAKGTSLITMIPGSLSGTAGNLRRGNVDLKAAAIIGGTSCLNTPLGAWTARVVDPRLASTLFVGVVSVIATQMVVQALHHR